MEKLKKECKNCKFALPHPMVEHQYFCMNEKRNKNVSREKRYKRTQDIGCEYCEVKHND